MERAASLSSLGSSLSAGYLTHHPEHLSAVWLALHRPRNRSPAWLTRQTAEQAKHATQAAAWRDGQAGGDKWVTAGCGTCSPPDCFCWPPIMLPCLRAVSASPHHCITACCGPLSEHCEPAQSTPVKQPPRSASCQPAEQQTQANPGKLSSIKSG